tara:strand:- start:216 stop:530 length:315 start_codon:yes stop_codon:yes gene_type:complete
MPDQAWALPALAGLTIAYGMLFYWLCYGLLTGLKVSSVNSEIEVADAWTARIIQLACVTVLYMSGDTNYMLVAAFALPWTVISVLVDIFATLIKWDILEVQDKE